MARLSRCVPLWIALACALVVGVFLPVSAGALTSIDGYWEYEPYGFSTITLTGYNGTDTALTIPSTVDGYRVVRLESMYGSGSIDDITSLVIPQGVLEISDDCFSSSFLLEDVQFPRSLTTIGSWAFCSAPLTSGVVLYDEIEEVGAGAFNSASASITIHLPGAGSMAYDLSDNPTPIFVGHSEFTVTFDTTGGSFVAPVTSVVWGSTVSAPFPDPAKINFAFGCWCSDFAGTQPYDFSTPVKCDLTLYAKWYSAYPTITFEANGGSPVPDPQAVAYNTMAVEPTAPLLTGKTLAGWFTTPDFQTGTQWNFATDPVVDDMMLYAKWETTRFTVSFVPDGGTPAPTAQTIDWGLTASKPASLSKTGYSTDDKWYIDSGCTMEFDFSTAVYQPYTLYAKWIINSYQVTFDAVGGAPAPGSQTVVYGGLVSEPASLANAGKVFDGWYTTPAYISGTQWNFALSTMPASNLVLYAKWYEPQLSWGSDYDDFTEPNWNLTYDFPSHRLDEVSDLESSLEERYGLSCFDTGCHGGSGVSTPPAGAVLPDLLAIHDSVTRGIDPYGSCSGLNGCHEGNGAPASGAFCDSCHDIATIHSSGVSGLVSKHETTSNPADSIASMYGPCENCHTNGCQACHSTVVSTSPNLLVVHSKTTEADTCRVCHASSGNWVSHIPYSDVHDVVQNGTTPNTQQAECVDCHATVHDSNTHSDVPAIHAVTGDFTSCSTGCHPSLSGATTLMAAHKGVAGATTDAQTCTICHDSTDQNVKDSIATGNTDCFALCHSEHGTISHDGSGYYATRPDLNCAQCHDPAGDLPAIHVVIGCVACHSSSASQDVQDAVAAHNDDCNACHVIHPIGDVTASHDAAGYYATAPNETGVACEVCHSTDSVGIHKSSDYCNTCHGGDTRPADNGSADIGCSNCHAASPTTPIHSSTDIANAHANAGGDSTCANCHETMKDLKGLDIVTIHGAKGCALCHSPKARRAVRDAVAAGNANCDACHHSNSPYLDWQDANTIYQGDGSHTSQDTPHGGYTTSTVKCVVCHSVHRASAEGVALTAADPCGNCHTAWGSGGSAKLIEWGNPASGVATGPHTGQGCLQICHGGSVHGAQRSQFAAMNHYMLGGEADQTIVDDFENGNVSDNITYVAGGGDGQGANWFQSGTTPVPWDGAPPQGVTAAQFAAAKATATGYTCSRSGCHDVPANGGQYAVNATGFVGIDTLRTGHGTGTVKDVAGTVATGCGPCHPGNAAGGYRRFDNIVNPNARAYGCDQCHDLIGRATNSTAWPHANKGIDVYEWDSAGSRVVTTKDKVVAGNLWMYRYNIAQVASSDEIGWDSTPRSDISGLSYDPRFVLINYGDVGGQNLLAGGAATDGTCLKCHVATDDASKVAAGVAPDQIDGNKLIPALVGGISKPIHVNPFIGNDPYAPNSKYIFQYR